MELIGGLLAHYQKLFRDKALESALIIEMIKKETGLMVKNNEIRLKEGTLFLKVKPKYKLEILLRKEKILLSFKEQGLKIKDLK